MDEEQSGGNVRRDGALGAIAEYRHADARIVDKDRKTTLDSTFQYQFLPSLDTRRFALWSKATLNVRNALSEEQAYDHAFLFIPVFLGGGALVWFSLAEQPGPIKLALLLCIFAMAAIALRHAGPFWSQTTRLLACFVGGMLLSAVETQRLDTVLLDTPVTTQVRGRVISRETTDRGQWRYLVALVHTSGPTLKRPPEKVSLLSRSQGAPIAIGQMIEGRARLSPPSGPALPGLNDFAFDSYFKGIGAVGFFYGAPHSVTAANDGATWSVGLPFVEEIARWREAIGMRIRTTIGGDAGAIAAALVTAEERAISRDTIEVLRGRGLRMFLPFPA
ncbi:DUF4131 domain-containing protein [Rhizobium sp. 32-5/1]|uniref:DUF4131 domain-containing protein n=1 Tax=Rhizobium sp. 32-5/1 TaxID=3019602 RepID=UPI0032B82F35